MNDKAKAHLFDMLTAARRVRDIVGTMTLIELQANQDKLESTLWNLSVLGEAAKRLVDDDASTTSRISHFKQIRGLRNRIVHGYDNNDLNIV